MKYRIVGVIALGGLCSLLILPAGCCGPKAGQWTASEASHTPLLPEGEPWNYHEIEGRIIQTPHYRVYTTVTDALLLEKLPVFLETAYQQYQAFLPAPKTQEQPMEIYLFARRSEWETYTRENMGSAAENYLKIRAGAYSHEGVCIAYLLPRYQTFGVLAHEGFHQFSSGRLEHRIPAWMEEGLACNFESHFWRAGKPDFAPDLNEFRLSALNQALLRNSLFPLPELLSMHAGEAVAMPAEKTATFYAQAWALSRFLQEGQQGKYQAGFRQLLTDAADGANLYSQERAMEIFQSYFKEDPDSINDEFVVFAKLLAARRVKPGMDVYVINSSRAGTTVQVTGEQIEQAKEQVPVQEPAESEAEPSSESPSTQDQPAKPVEDQPIIKLQEPPPANP